ncbi:Cyclin A/CDK2-associated protein [Perkinsela sp. CCAP 1560/4]|nr:Cyclin A/CDK2-associated protein [Perkinsela sp. CCAP 1560/4]|eukprot:KNH06081.1 Cyclin A/CDK2-associated protein [Perkinsela sp. CCAP 1560/4]
MSAEPLILSRGLQVHEIDSSVAFTDSDCLDYCALITTDQKKYKTPRKLIQASEVIRDILLENEGIGVEVPVNTDSVVLELIFEFLQHHENEPMATLSKPLKKKLKDVVGEWYYTFCTEKLLKNGNGLGHSILFKVLHASSELLIIPLRELCSAFVASIIIGKTDEDVRNLLCIDAPLTPDDEKTLYEKYPWLCEKKQKV